MVYFYCCFLIQPAGLVFEPPVMCYQKLFRSAVQQKPIKAVIVTSVVNKLFVPLCPPKPIDTKADVSKCVFWEYEPASLQGRWAMRGCKTVHVDSNATTCSCNHLTHFAILMSSGRANVSDLTLKIQL